MHAIILENGRHNTQQNDIHYNGTQHKGIICDIRCNDIQLMTLSIAVLSHYAECHAECRVLNIVMLSVMSSCWVSYLINCYAGCHYAEWHVWFIVMLNVIVLGDIMLSVVMLNVNMLSVVELGKWKPHSVMITNHAFPMLINGNNWFRIFTSLT